MLGKVLITAKSFLISPEPMKILQEAGCEAEYRAGVFPVNEDRLIEQVGEIDALVFGMESVTRRLLDAAPRLKVIARPGVGYDRRSWACQGRDRCPWKQHL